MVAVEAGTWRLALLAGRLEGEPEVGRLAITAAAEHHCMGLSSPVGPDPRSPAYPLDTLELSPTVASCGVIIIISIIAMTVIRRRHHHQGQHTQPPGNAPGPCRSILEPAGALAVAGAKAWLKRNKMTGEGARRALGEGRDSSALYRVGAGRRRLPGHLHGTCTKQTWGMGRGWGGGGGAQCPQPHAGCM